jgi:phosphoribosylamine-glycine ligase
VRLRSRGKANALLKPEAQWRTAGRVQVVTSGGRVLAVTCTAPTLGAAISGAYAGIAEVNFDGIQCAAPRAAPFR